MTAFTTAELRRLSELATAGPWLPSGTPSVLVLGVAACERERDAALIAYLGTHREAIIAMLEAADALAEADYALCNVLHFAAIPGAAEVAPVEYVIEVSRGIQESERRVMRIPMRNGEPLSLEEMQERQAQMEDQLNMATGEIQAKEAELIHLRAENARLHKLFNDAGQGEHNVLALVDFYMEQNAALSAKASAGEASANALGRIESALGRAGNFPVDETVQEIEALVAKLRLATAVADYGPRFTDRHMNDAAESVLDELRAALDGRSPI